EVHDSAAPPRVLFLARWRLLLVLRMEEELGEGEIHERAAVGEPVRRRKHLARKACRRVRLLDEHDDLRDAADARHTGSVTRRCAWLEPFSRGTVETRPQGKGGRTGYCANRSDCELTAPEMSV